MHRLPPTGRIVAWAALRGDVPRQWLAQLNVGGAVVVPIAGTGHAIRFELTQQGFVEDARLPASFVPMTPAPYRPWETGCEAEPPVYEEVDDRAAPKENQLLALRPDAF